MTNEPTITTEFSTTLRPQTRDRENIDPRFTWDLSHIYTGWQAWEADLETVGAMMAAYRTFEGTLAEGPLRLLAVLELADKLGHLAYKVYRYPGLIQNQDTRDNAITARLERVQILFARFHQATAWYTPELLRIPEESMRQWLDETPALAPYRFGILDTYRRQEHTLDEKGERLLAFAEPFGSTPAESYSMLADADVSFPSVTLSDGSRITAGHASYQNGLHTLRSPEDRENLFRAHFEVFDRTPNTWAAIYQGILQRDWFLAQARNYPSTLEASLDGDRIPLEVVEGLISTAREGVAPLRRYHALRKKYLGLDRYRYFDAYVPLVDLDWPLPYDEVAPMIVESVALFGADYRETVRRAFAERWIDVYENEGKRSGAFSAGVYGVHPYMLLNYADTLSDAFTVAHEMGHTMHTVLSHRHQPFATSEYTIFVAEVASMTNESLFLDHLLSKESDPARRIALLQHAVDDICAGFYRQAMFADFELQAHRLVENGSPITAEVLQKLYLETLRAFFGETLDDQEWYRNTWARIPHFFASPYYVFQYATSKVAAGLIHQRLTTGSEEDRRQALHDYLTLLGSGGDDYPLNQMKKTGVDFSTPEPMTAIVATANRLVQELENTLEDAG